MTNEDLKVLNEEQLVALKQTEGAVLVTAGAGSGKTRLLTHRIVYLMENIGVKPEEILAITFTNKATNEMKERITKMSQLGSRVWISTFHSMCVRILRQFINRVDVRLNQNFSIYADAESDKVLKNISVKNGITDEKIIKAIKVHISNIKNNNYSLTLYHTNLKQYSQNADLFIKVIREYQEELLENNALDFDDLLVKTYELFVKNPDILEMYANRFKYILVDEFQDTNLIQYQLVKLLASKHKNIFVVGDEDQCIYTWRGANFKNIFDFKKDFENVSVFKLERNYRSTKQILSLANKLIKHNRQRIDKTLYSENPEGETALYKEVYDEQEEADYVAFTIHNLVKNKGYHYSDFAILLRLNALSFAFEEKLLSYNIPHKIYGGFKFYERAEIKNVLAYLRLFINPKDTQAFSRVINFPKRGIGEVSVQKIFEIAKEKNVSAVAVAINPVEYGLPNAIITKLNSFADTYNKLFAEYELTSLHEFCENVVEEFGIKNAFNKNVEEELEKLLNIDQLLHSIEEFEKQNQGVTLSDYLQTISLIGDMDTADGDDNVTVATVHAVKGLEFKVVFLVGLEEKIFPVSRAFNNENDMEEERRLMYVGITRAEEKLFLTSTKTRYMYGHRDYMLKSRFIAEAGLDIETKHQTVFNTKSSRTVNGQVDYVKMAINGNANIKPSQPQETHSTLNFKVGQTVEHTRFGQGTIIEIDNEEGTADIDFASVGMKTLILELAPIKIIKES